MRVGDACPTGMLDNGGTQPRVAVAGKHIPSAAGPGEIGVRPAESSPSVLAVLKLNLFTIVLLGWTVLTAAAHPVPDVPVRAVFGADGSAVIQVEVDPRCFEKHAAEAPYLLQGTFVAMEPPAREALKARALEFIRRTIEFRFEPLGRFDPEFAVAFTTHAGAPLTKPDDPVMLTATWRTRLPAGLEGYRIKALESGALSVLFLNEVNGQVLERIHVLFPGETSFLLDLTGLTTRSPTQASPGSVTAGSDRTGRWVTFWQFLQSGYVHVVPLGLDHILFVLGLFLLSRDRRTILWQVTLFTVAHTVTLGLATIGVVTVPASVVEPIIAGSIAAVALENIFRPAFTPTRIGVVIGFGLVHGLGFAGALAEMRLPPSSLLVGLLGFNVGVEFGQLTVIALAWVATLWIKDPVHYRRRVVIPGSLLIALPGLWWMIERIVGR
ncbi:MAG: HupE/UreJ family protein [Opitutaceae bacterium]|nr:HupE/UreJ family protein [Opitutaceae bacterium]